MSIFTDRNIFELPLCRDYVRHWGMAQAVRELIQNALDSESPFEWQFDQDPDSLMFRLRIKSRYATLPASSLLLGSTTKADAADKIGSFGEGYKIALLVLCRSGYDPQVFNGDRLWRPVFVMNRAFGAEILTIHDTPLKAGMVNEGVTFEVNNLSAGDVEAIEQSCLQMQKNIGRTLDVKQGRILYDRPGKLYVGGLFICDTSLEYGYDVMPKYITLERDRQTVSGWDLQCLSRDMWFETQRYDEVAEKIERDCPDLKYAEYHSPEIIKEACYRLFRSKHPGKVMARNQKEADELVKQGMTVYVGGGAYYSNVTQCRDYSSAGFVRVRSPHDIMQEFYETHRRGLSAQTNKALKDLVEESRAWSRK